MTGLLALAVSLAGAACGDDGLAGRDAQDAEVASSARDAQSPSTSDAAVSKRDAGASTTDIPPPDIDASTSFSDGGRASTDSATDRVDGGRSEAGDAKAAVGPCDLYASATTPCVAAHSTVRALFGAYTAPLYQVRRASDRTTKDIGVLTPGGFADAAAQDAFCANTSCTIAILYDQSGRGNHLTHAPAGGAKPSPDNEASATALKLTVGGHTVYGIRIDAGMGYRNNKTSGVAKGDQPEGEYMVTSGKHFNGGCCFDYGNAETSNNDDGNGTMEAIYFGNSTTWGKGAGSGPWVMADLENGLFAGSSLSANNRNTPLTHDYVTALIKGRAGGFALKGGNAQTGALTTMYDGARPAGGYDPMKKQRAIILGIGGDNSNSAVGSFFEGAMTEGYPSDAADDAVQANIVAAGYGE